MNNTINIEQMIALSTKARSAILAMTTLASSGHPGGSMSSIDLLIALYHTININPENPQMPDRDRVIVSHGHISPAVYSTLALRGFFDLNEVITSFRLAGSIFEGHIEPEVPGVEWATGNLGQGLSAACGFALSGRLKGIDNQVYCLMGDGEQQKGQLSEARRFAVKYKLNNITAIIDYNRLQICGDINKVMPQNIKENYESDGWVVLNIDGHNYPEILEALEKSKEIDAPVLILAETTMGKGVSFMENNEKYHGSTINEDALYKAFDELGVTLPYEEYKQKRNNVGAMSSSPANNVGAMSSSPANEKHLGQDTPFPHKFRINTDKIYETATDNRSAWGDAVADLGKSNQDKTDSIAVFDNDLKGSVKTADFEKAMPSNFFQSGIMEHHTVVCAGALSKTGVQTFIAGFGVFGIGETYNQHRLNDINHTNLKTILTHVGLDVGEDGKTHQCIDYIGLTKNLYNTKIIIPADPNQTYKATHYIANQQGNYLMAMGRSKTPIIKTANGEIFYGKNYTYQYGKSDILREGSQATIFVTGTLVKTALQIVDELNHVETKRASSTDIRLIYISSPFEIESDVIISAAQTGYIFTLEDHNIQSGLGAIIAQNMIKYNATCPLISFGVSHYACSGSADDVYKFMGLDALSIKRRICEVING